MTTTQPSAELRLRDDVDFRRYWWARLLSLSGTVISYVALPVLVYRLSGSALVTALVSALEAAPYLLFGLFAGALADRWDRKVVMVSADLVNTAVMLSVPIAFWLHALTILHVLAVAFAVPAIAVFFDGANFGAMPVLVGRGRIAQANAAIWGAATSLEIVLPSLVGVALAVVQPASMLAADAASYAASALLVSRIGRMLHDPTRQLSRLTVRRLFADISEGLRFLARHDGVRTMTIVAALQSVAGGGFVALMVVWCDRVLGIGTQGLRFGLVYGAWSVGGLVASSLLPRILKTASAASITLRAVPFSALLGVLTCFASVWPLAALGLFSWSCVYTLVVVNSISYRQQVTPEHLLGRVNTAGRMLAWGFGWTLGAAGGGLLGSVVDIRAAMAVMASASVCAAGVAWMSPLRYGVE